MINIGAEVVLEDSSKGPAVTIYLINGIAVKTEHRTYGEPPWYSTEVTLFGDKFKIEKLEKDIKQAVEVTRKKGVEAKL